MSISLIQRLINQENLDGWALYDFHHTNDLMWELLKFPRDAHVTRRVFYWIPREGKPVKVVHAIEKNALDFLEGDSLVYRTQDELKEVLRKTLGKKIAMEVSSEIPVISKVDAGTFTMLQGLGIEIISSGKLLQRFTSVLSEEQIKAHLEAADVVSKTADKAFEFVRGELLQGKLLYEGDVQEFILNRFTDAGCITDHSPIVARGANSANPHYMPKGRGAPIKRGDFLLIDLWCKRRGEHGVYGDITRVACTEKPTEKQQAAFEVVREAQRMAVEMIEMNETVRGCDVDRLVREYLEERGYKDNILHRLGHNITGQLHGNGANLDSFETMDERELIDNTCYSVEPALYFPGEFGLRLEFDILYRNGKVQVTGGVQDSLTVLV